MKVARVIARSTGIPGNSIGHYDSIPMLNTKVYDVMCPGSAIQQFPANIIAERLYENLDKDGHRYQNMDEIIGHKKLNSAIPKVDGFMKSKSCQRKNRITIKDWKFFVL